LGCSGCKTVTTHRFWTEKLIGRPEQGKGYEQLYVCLCCGEVRRYGVSARGRDIVIFNSGGKEDGR
jgi:hypothetical protein